MVRATGPRPPGWVSKTLLVISLCMLLDQASGQQICSQTKPGSCPNQYYCTASSLCKKISDGNTTTYIILGVVLIGIVIIVCAILILYCGKWGWLNRLKDRAAGQQRPKRQQLPPPMMQPGLLPPNGPLLFQQPKPTLGRRLKLRFGGLQNKSPYMGTSTPYVSSPTPSVIGSAAYTIPPQNVGLKANTTYVIGQGGNSGPEPDGPGPYVASMNVDNASSNLPAIEYPGSGGGPHVGEQVVQVGGVQQNSPYHAYQPRYTPPPSPQPYRHESHSPQPYRRESHSPQPYRREHATNASFPPQYQPCSHVPQPQPQPHTHTIMPHTHAADIVPHTHQMPPSVYPSLDAMYGHGHTHSVGPPSYVEAPRKV